MATTTTTTTTTGTDTVTSVQPAVHNVPAELLAPSGSCSSSGNPATLLVVNAETNNCKPPVLHTDL
ncbi:GL22698 [Drosophila persimilis]|nr:GL22698 [Drosophila persimilis]